MGRPAAAFAHIMRALNIRKAGLRPGDPGLTETYMFAGNLSQQVPGISLEASMDLLEEARESLRKSGTGNRAQIASMDFEQGKLLFRLKRYAESADKFGAAHRIR